MYRYGLFQHTYIYFTIYISVHVTYFILLMILKRKKERKELGGRVPLLINWNHDAPESITKPNTKQGKSLSHPTCHDLVFSFEPESRLRLKHQLAATTTPSLVPRSPHDHSSTRPWSYHPCTPSNIFYSRTYAHAFFRPEPTSITKRKLGSNTSLYSPFGSTENKAGISMQPPLDSARYDRTPISPAHNRLTEFTSRVLHLQWMRLKRNSSHKPKPKTFLRIEPHDHHLSHIETDHLYTP